MLDIVPPMTVRSDAYIKTSIARSIVSKMLIFSKKFYAPYQLSRYLANHPHKAKHFLPSGDHHLDEFIARHSNKRSKSPTPFDLASARFPNQVHSIHTRGLDDMKNCYFSPVTCYLLEGSRR
ncbi:hypothetical protein DdX_10205 [Ditylenchus destructor]|uniref:Uncharacterized protein n=1 Tax=Ditylenchus destructor TaxID=166010 RepID=A0AAD4MY93_9BILA|nr:hypothetical protein DdX_10205 [Ditylenchus destructor]